LILLLQVKCDASRPYCTPCLKSARGNTTVATERCAYEGTSVAIATANRAAEIQKNGGTKRKKRQPKGTVVKDEDESEGNTRKRKKKSTREVEETLPLERGESDSRDGSRSLGPEDEDELEGNASTTSLSTGGELPRFSTNQLPSVFMNPNDYQHPSQHSASHPDQSSYPQYGGRAAESAPSNSPWQSSIRPLDAAYSQAAPSRFTLPNQSNGDRLPDPTNGVDGEKEQLAGRVGKLDESQTDAVSVC